MAVRDLSVIMSELTTAANNINAKKKALDDATKTVNEASKAYDDAQIAAGRLRAELDEQLNLLVPSSTRVRQS